MFFITFVSFCFLSCRELEKDFDPNILYTYDFLLTKPQFRFPIELSSGFCPSQWEYSGEDTFFKFSNNFDELYNEQYMEIEGDFMYDDNEAENLYSEGAHEKTPREL